jgi:endonuclease/exonuclease/phosphatase family metal-dependent hydrolase
VRVLTWNLLHGRSVPGAGHDLLDEFATALAGWDWDVALLQEVPPWWPKELGARTGSDSRSVLTSRNALLPLRRAVAIRWPDLIKSNGGGSNAILVRGAAIVEYRTFRLCLWPERRWLHAVLLGHGVWVGNLHTEARADQGRLAAETLLAWADGHKSILGGDFNVDDLTLDGFVRAGSHHGDHVFMRGLSPEGEAQTLDRGRLSDHAPLSVMFSSG